MYSEIYYLVRSKADGQYLVARPTRSPDSSDRPTDSGFLLIFREQYDAMSYLNTHGKDVVDRFAIESVGSTQLDGVLKRWNFTGVGMVQDALVPRVEFLTR